MRLLIESFDLTFVCIYFVIYLNWHIITVRIYGAQWDKVVYTVIHNDGPGWLAFSLRHSSLSMSRGFQLLSLVVFNTHNGDGNQGKCWLYKQENLRFGPQHPTLGGRGRCPRVRDITQPSSNGTVQ